MNEQHSTAQRNSSDCDDLHAAIATFYVYLVLPCHVVSAAAFAAHKKILLVVILVKLMSLRRLL